MSRRQLQRRYRARLHQDERGFSLIETLIAITVIFASLMVLAYAATASFRYQGIARQIQTANGIAAKVMEEVRGLAYDRITQGLLSTDLTGDPNIVNCSGTYRFLSCSAGADPGSGEKIVNSPGLTTAVPLVPHRSSTSPNTNPTVNNISFTWATYVTRDDSVSSAAYRVTVIVTWTQGVSGGSKVVRIQSLFWSPIGCASTSTHPFAAPCQPFYLANATVPNGDITVSGTVGGTTFSEMQVSLMGASATVQQEQIPSAEGSVHPVEASITDDATSSAGGQTVASDADGDPGTTSGTYSRHRCGTEVACTGATLTEATNAGGTTYVQITVPTTTVGEADAATSATASYPCPPSLISATLQGDALPCAGAAVSQSTVMNGVAHLHGLVADVGDATLVRVAAQTSNQATAFVDRVTNPAPTGAGCTPAVATDGCIASSAARAYGNIRLAGFPSNMSPPGSLGNCAASGTFYLINLIGYTGSATAAAGYGSPAPNGAAPGGTLYYWNAATNSCASLPASSSSITGLDSHYTTSQMVGSNLVTVSMSTVTSETTAAVQSSTATPSTGGSVTRTYARAQCQSPVITVSYTITSGGTTILDVTEVLNLGTLLVDATYAPAPTGA